MSIRTYVYGLAAALLTAGATVALAAEGGEAGRLGSDLSRMGKLTNSELKPAARQLAHDLPGESDRLTKLREPASTAQAQLKVALTELREMKALTYDPHYMPALTATCRAYLAVSGLDPVTGTAVNPEYRGLDSELAADAARLDESAGGAAGLSKGIGRLGAELVRARRRTRLIERQIRANRAARASARHQWDGRTAR